MLKRRTVVALGVWVAAGLLAGGVAFALIPDADGVIHGCRNKRSGALRVINYPSQQCADNERPINWNQTGPQGPAGVAGYVVVTEEEGILAAAPTDTVDTIYEPDADCPTGKVPIGAGWDAFTATRRVAPTFVSSKAVAHTWRWGIIPGPAAYTFRMHLICATAG